MGFMQQATSIAKAATAEQLMFELQVEQHFHDEQYHREIARLSLHQRLNHMALHFAKYTGKIASAPDIAATAPIYVDILIIALSTANMLNTKLWDLLEVTGSDFPNLLAVGRSLAVSMPHKIMTQEALLSESATATGRIAAACEKIDHLEDISFRREIAKGIACLSELAFAALGSQHIDPALAVRERLAAVKERLKLHGRI